MGKFEKIKYPDGQVGAKWVGDLSVIHNVAVIKERINSYEDLAYVRAIADILEYHKSECSLEIPCLFGQRSDRRFSDDASFDLRFITDTINSCNFLNVTVLDPHSDVCMALLRNSHKKTSFPYVQDSVLDIRRRMYEEGLSSSGDDILLVSPDAGAYKKVFEYGEKLNLPVMGAMKHRDKDGKIDLMFSHDVEGKDCLIVDDLCDGGYTFELLGKALKEHKARKVYLYVSHGLFSKGFTNLYEIIDHIYCTNSVKDIGEYEFTTTLGVINTSDYVTQYKVI